MFKKCCFSYFYYFFFFFIYKIKNLDVSMVYYKINEHYYDEIQIKRRLKPSNL